MRESRRKPTNGILPVVSRKNEHTASADVRIRRSAALKCIRHSCKSLRVAAGEVIIDLPSCCLFIQKHRSMEHIYNVVEWIGIKRSGAKCFIPKHAKLTAAVLGRTPDYRRTFVGQP